MPASEQSYYNLKRLHVLFATAALALLAATLWMLAADHWRQWKAYQRTYRDTVEPWMTEARIRAVKTGEFNRRQQELAAALAGARAAVPDGALIERFSAEIVSEITRAEQQAAAALAAHRAALDRLGRTLEDQRPNLAKRLLSLPIVDAFGRPLAIDQIWLPELTIDYNFREVARCDRCATCHQAVAAAVPGAPWQPACLPEVTLTAQLVANGEGAAEAAGAMAPAAGSDGRHTAKSRPGLRAMYGLALARQGILDPQAPTVGLVLPRTPAAAARLVPGDVIVAIDGRPIHSRAEAAAQLLQPPSVPTGADAADGPEERQDAGRRRRVQLKIRRGLPHPFHSHPRLDLFVGPQSPHPMGKFGCTICHDGQGSGTEFKWVSHTPNSPAQRQQWHQRYDWFCNPHWEFPMLPRRFAQSRCLKCHHDVTDLEPSQRFTDPPAAKLLRGYELIRQNGCFGCHEIKGRDSLGTPVGPDMRLEPGYAEAARQLLADPKLPDQQRRLAEQVIARPEDAGPRQDLVASISARRPEIVNTPRRAALIDILATDDPHPGTMRKVGPTLRDAAGKVKADFLRDRLRDPTRFLPATRMPAFYEMHEHLDGRGLADAQRFEVVEIRAVAQYLLDLSQPVAPLPSPAGVTEAPAAERGKQFFQIRGCLACHKHGDFPKGSATTGPDLSNVGAKFTADRGTAWLIDWLRDPVHQSPRTIMPNMFLTPIPRAEPVDSASTPAAVSDAPAPAKMTDPAADIAAYLLTATGWKPREFAPLDESELDQLVLAHLRKMFPEDVAREYLLAGIPAARAGRIQGDEVALLGPIDLRKKLQYVGSRTIRKRGCYGCHDIPGFEDAPAIGPALSDWGRKQESLLAFEQINRYLAVSGQGQKALTGDDPDRAFFTEALLAHRREGFVWQKLRAPRSFDFERAQNKDYNERLTMGRFNFMDDEIEAVITFVLGLVAEPPAKTYVYQPSRRKAAISGGDRVLAKYACAECHTLQMEQWRFEFDPEGFENPPATADYPFLQPRFTAQELGRSTASDNRGLASAKIVGMPRVNADGLLLEDEDDDGNPLYFFTLWEPAAINGQVWTVGGPEVIVSARQRTAVRPPRGGAFARLLYPFVLAEAKATGASASELEAWGWVPPPLVHEGKAVRPAWLHDYLLAPDVIRPAAVLRMPRYNLSAAEAATLGDYFAAAAGAEFPYVVPPARRTGPLATELLQRALALLVDRKTFCAKCHLIGDFSPGGETRTTLAPNLDRVGRRLRPEHLRRWLANPRAMLPYTAMPVNFPLTGPPHGQDIFPGASIEQLDAVLALLLDYDWYMSHRTSIQGLVESEDARSARPVFGRTRGRR